MIRTLVRETGVNPVKGRVPLLKAQAQGTAEGHQGCGFGYLQGNFVEWETQYGTRAELLWTMAEWLTPSTSGSASSLPPSRAHSLSVAGGAHVRR